MSTRTLAKPGRFLSFVLDSQMCAVPVESVREINQYTDVTPVPNTPSFVVGVINLRGKIVPVVDLKVKFGMKPHVRTRNSCIVVMDCDHGQVGAIVDEVQDVIDLAEENIEQSPEIGNIEDMAYLLGIGKIQGRVIILVDVVNSLSKDQFLKKMILSLDQVAA